MVGAPGHPLLTGRSPRRRGPGNARLPGRRFFGSGLLASVTLLLMVGLVPVSTGPVGAAGGEPAPLRVLILGDDVLLAAEDRLPGACDACEVVVDAESGRSVADGAAAARHEGPFDLVVVLLGHHEAAEDATAGFGDLFDRFALTRRIIVLAPAGTGPDREALRESLDTMAEERPNVTIAPWASLVFDHPDAVTPDGRLTPAGASLLTYLIGAEIAAARPDPGPGAESAPPTSRPESAPPDEPSLDEESSGIGEPLVEGPDAPGSGDDRSEPSTRTALLGILGAVVLALGGLGILGRLRR